MPGDAAGRGFERGTLWARLTRRTRQALRSGALQPMATECEFIEQSGARFVVRVASQLAGKQRTRGKPNGGNPFLPHEPDLFVADVSETHVGLLNKFNVLEHHLLVVTRDFQDQERPLDPQDFEALWSCMAEFDALAFYNAGRTAGASQAHKHLQLVPLPLAPGAEGIPIEPLLEGARHRLPFAHTFVRIELESGGSVRKIAERTLETYRTMLRAQCAPGEPYNLLVTRRWMLLVPRSRESFESISINALGFAGALLVRDERQLQRVRERGPLALLEAVAVSRRRE